MEIDRFHTILYHWHVVGKRVTPFYSKIVQSILWFESFPRAMRKAFKIYTILLTVPQVFPRRKPCSMKPRWNCYCDSSFNERVSGFDHQIIFSLGPLEAAIELNQSMSPNHSLGRQQRRRLCNYEFSSIRVITSLPQQTRNLTSRRSVTTQNVGQNFSKPREIIYLNVRQFGHSLRSCLAW